MPHSLKPEAETEAEQPHRPRDKRDRKATEEAIVAAFEAVLLRDGVQGLGVNAVAHEAGVNKVLIYRYFGGFPGLASEWAKESSFWPTELELIGTDEASFAKLEVRDRVVSVLREYMTSVRSRPLTVEVLAGELLSPNDTTKALSDAMIRPGRGVADYIELDKLDEDISERVWRLIYIVSALTAFFSIRERNNPTFLGVDLSDDESWDLIRDIVGDVAQAYLKD
jgi:AcrR family transcriptional regulator